MYLLGFETTGPIGSAALIDGRVEVFMKITEEKMSHLKEVARLADELMRERGIKPSAVSAVAASIGPGSFTGIRIGVSLARAFSQGLGIPCISVPTLSMFAGKGGADCKTAVIFNARRGQVYGAVFREDGSELLAPGPYMLEDVIEATKGAGSVKFYGDGCDAYADRLAEVAAERGDRIIIADEDERYQTAEMLVREALRKFNEGQTVSYGELMPDYMRMAEAEQKLRDGSLKREQDAKRARFRN